MTISIRCLCVDAADPAAQAAEVARFEALGARRVELGQSDDVSWVVLADPEGNEFCILRALTPEELAE